MEHVGSVIVGDLDFISEKRSLGSGFRAYEGVGDFSFPPAMHNPFAVRAPAEKMNEARRLHPSILDILLDMSRGMVARGNIPAFAIRTPVQENVNIFVNILGFFSEMSSMAKRGTSLFLRLSAFLFLVFSERCLQSPRQLLLDAFLFILKLLNPFAKPDYLFGSKVNGTFKFVNPCPEIVSFGNDFFRRFSAEIQAGFVERAIEFQVFLARRIKPPLFHCSHPELLALRHRTPVDRYLTNRVSRSIWVVNLL